MALLHLGRLRAALAAALVLSSACGSKGSAYSVGVAPERLDFAAEQGGALPPAQSVEVTFNGDGLLVGFPPGVSSAWLSAAATRQGSNSATISVRVTTTSLPPGSHATTLRFVTGKADGSDFVTRDVAVRLQIAPPPASLSGTSSASITEAARWADLDLPLTLRTALDPAAGAACSWQASSDQAWLAVAPASGHLGADTPLVAHLDPDRLWALANGRHGAVVSVQLGAGCPRPMALSLRVSLDLLLRPALQAAPVAFRVAPGSIPADFTRSVTLTSNLGEVWTSRGAWTASSSAPWLRVTPPSGSGSGSLSLSVDLGGLSDLPAGESVTDVVLSPADPRLAAPDIPVSVTIALPTIRGMAPHATWVGRPTEVIVRGGGFAGGSPPVLQVGSRQVAATVLSDTELRAIIPSQAATGRLAVRIANDLGLDRGGAELAVLPLPAYGPTSLALGKYYSGMVLDAERQAVLVTGYGTNEVRRLRWEAAAWTSSSVALDEATGAAVALDGREILVGSGYSSSTSTQRVVHLDGESLVTLRSTAFQDMYSMYSLIVGFNDGRIMLIDSDQWATFLWYPALSSGPYLSVHDPEILLTRDRSRLLVRPMSINFGDVISTYDAAETVFRARIKPKAFDARAWDVSANGGRLLDGVDLYDRDFAQLGRVVLPEPSPTAAALSPDGSTAYALSSTAQGWVLRQADLTAAAGPYPAAATPLPFVLPAGQAPLSMRVSEDGGALFILAFSSSAGVYSSYFHALPLR